MTYPAGYERTAASSRRCLKCGDRCRMIMHAKGLVELRCYHGHSFWPHLNAGTMTDKGEKN